MDNFEVKKVYEKRTYERHRFSFSLNGKEFKGNFHENGIQWLHPHPKQDVDADHLEWIEGEIYRLVGEDDTLDEVDDIEVKPFLADQSHEAHQFKLKIDDEEFKGIIRNGNLEWFHPKPRRKVKDEKVEKAEKRIHEKVKEQKEG
ncbi:HicA family toxin-antitoxin system [Virgibacillus siamensis]|uniref:HicA family toxin-antitoxin system n=1 Tax=Virgibacillus siamensis TaxID=480071 RepID=UPI0009873FF3|nr:HicA family toxin-antitoxin system [Virgibacillus siamensis]